MLIRALHNNLGRVASVVVAGILCATGQSRAADAVPSDVSSIGAIVAAAYESISGPANAPKDWARLRFLFRPDGRLIVVAPSGDDSAKTTVMDVDAYQARVTPSFARNPFFEKGVSERVEQFGHIAHVLSVYESRRDPKDAKPFARGINSFQLVHDGRRWWIQNLLWQAETPTDKIPARFLNGPQ